MNTTPETGSVTAAIVTRNGRAYCRACGTNACPHIQGAHRARLIYAPTVATLRALLDDMERAGVNPNTRVRVDHLTNAPGTFNVQPLADTPNDVRLRDAYGI